MQQLRLNLFLASIPTEIIRQNLGHADVKITQAYIGVLDGATRAPMSVKDASAVLEKLYGKQIKVSEVTSSDRIFEAIDKPHILETFLVYGETCKRISFSAQ